MGAGVYERDGSGDSTCTWHSREGVRVCIER
jgi:hypothetical protein